jgi:hypothetical protein
MNTASRIESTGEPNRVHLSYATAELLIAAGKAHWLRERKNGVEAKGKGRLMTYWLATQPATGSTESGASNGRSTESEGGQRLLEPFVQEEASTTIRDAYLNAIDTKQERLVEWHVDLILRLLRELSARREALDLDNPHRRPPDSEEQLQVLECSQLPPGVLVLDEVKEIVMLPNFNAIADKYQRNPDSIELTGVVVDQVRDYVRSRKSNFECGLCSSSVYN